MRSIARAFFCFVFLMRLYRALRVVVAVVVGFAEDRMMDIITGRAPPPARAESHLSKGSRELALLRGLQIDVLGMILELL